jgi:hypothetical protein
MTRLSCHRFGANEMRLSLRLITYNLMNLWRWLALPEATRRGLAPCKQPKTFCVANDEFAIVTN